jgi:hypothetical protein
MSDSKRFLPCDEEIRRLAGLNGRQIADYDPESAVTRTRNKWRLLLVGGKDHPETFGTRREAVEMGIRHKCIKEEQFRTPQAWFSLESLLAVDVIARVKEIVTRPGMYAMFENDHYRIALQEQTADREQWAREATKAGRAAICDGPGRIQVEEQEMRI